MEAKPAGKLAGIALILFGLDVEGKTAIGTGLATFATGFVAPAARVEAGDG